MAIATLVFEKPKMLTKVWDEDFAHINQDWSNKRLHGAGEIARQHFSAAIKQRLQSGCTLTKLHAPLLAYLPSLQSNVNGGKVSVRFNDVYNIYSLI